MSKPVPFAHLLGFGKKSRAENGQDDDEAKRAQWAKLAEEDPEREQKDDESDDDYEARMKAMDEEDEKDEQAESDLDGADDQDPDKDANKDAKKASRAARSSERARCAAIVAAGIKANQLHTACSLAFDTSMSSSGATKVLAMSRHDKSGSSLASRMAGVDIPNPGTAAGKSGGDALTDKLVSMAKAHTHR